MDYRKALRDLKLALEKTTKHLQHCGMNNTEGTIAVIDMVLKDPEKLMYFQSLRNYEIPEKYLKKLRKWKEAQRKKMEKGKGDNDA